MGCRYSAVQETEDNSVESIRYSRRSTKIKPSKRKKLSKTKSGGHETKHNGSEDNMPDQEEIPNSVTEEGASKKSKDSRKKLKKKNNTNERSQMFGNQSIKNVLTLSVDTPEAADMEAKQGKFGSKHVFPIWESHFNETCKCVNKDPSDNSTPPSDRRKSSLNSDHLCKRCSQLVLNNKRTVTNNNNSSDSPGTIAGPVSPDGATANSVDNVPSDPNSLKSDPFQTLAQQTQIAAIANLLVLVRENL